MSGLLASVLLLFDHSIVSTCTLRMGSIYFLEQLQSPLFKFLKKLPIIQKTIHVFGPGLLYIVPSGLDQPANLCILCTTYCTTIKLQDFVVALKVQCGLAVYIMGNESPEIVTTGSWQLPVELGINKHSHDRSVNRGDYKLRLSHTCRYY